MTDIAKTSFSYKDLIREICNELNIKCQTLSKDWAFALEKDGKKRFICGFKFDSNAHGLGVILDDKYAMYDLLRINGIDAVEHNIIYKSTNNNEYANDCKGIEYLKILFDKYNHNIVLKSNRGSCGVGVKHICNEDLLESTFEEMIASKHSLSVCPFYNIANEYRAILIGGNIRLIYKKVKPLVIGDGIKTIKELLVEFNPDYFDKLNDEELLKVLPVGQTYEYGWKFNLSRGAKSSLDIDESEAEEISRIIDKVRNIGNVNFCSVDIIKTTDNKYMVMEINSGIMMKNFIAQNVDGIKIAKSIYTEAIKKMFE